MMCTLCGRFGSASDHGIEQNVSGTASASATKPIYNGSQVIHQLRDGGGDGVYWQWIGTANISYSMPDTSPAGSESAGFRTMTATMKSWAGQAFEMWDDLVAINLNPSTSVNADITFAYSSQTRGGGTYAGFGGTFASSGLADISNAEVWANSGWTSHNDDADFYFGSYGNLTYLHEIGHTLGLSHPGRYDAGAGGSISFTNSAEFYQDTHQYTVMSYFEADDNGSGIDWYGSDGQWKHAQTPMLYDVLAIQAIYGADMTTRAGNTTYGFNSNAGRDVFNFAINRNPVLTIWDGAGVDTLDASGFTQNQVLNLAAGTFSSLGAMTNNVAIAFGATIENAVGGSGADAIYGNEVANTLHGGAGADSVYGGAGNDIIDGGTGRDSLYGGDGHDRINYDGADDLANVLGGGGWDTLVLGTNAAIPTGFGLAAHGFEVAEIIYVDSGVIQPWSWIVTYYSDGWAADSQSGAYDAGGQWYYDWDTRNETNWTTYAAIIDANGAIDYHYLSFDNNYFWYSDVDNANTQTWTSYSAFVDAGGRLDTIALLYDDSTRWEVDYDNLSQFNWQYMGTLYNANGSVTLRQTLFDSGLSVIS